MNQQKIFSTLERILESEVFVSSFRAKALLKYLITNYEKGEESDFSSYTIALEVFEREQDFDPSLDPIVRVQMGRLRVLLSKYYLQEGTTEDVAINIPRGSYKPRIIENDVPKKVTSIATSTDLENYAFPKVHLSSLSILKDEEEQTSLYFKEVLFSRLLRTNFFQMTDNQDADFYISFFKNEKEIGVTLKNGTQHGLSTHLYLIDENNASLELLLLFVQRVIDGPYGIMEKHIVKNSAFSWIQKFIQFEEEILEKGWLEFVGELIGKLEKVLEITKNSFVATVLIKYYHIDYQYNLLNYPKGLERANELYKTYNNNTSDFLVENCWSKIYHGFYDEALRIFQQVQEVEGKHLETTIQELLLFGYFGKKEEFYALKNNLLKTTEELPSICITMEALLLLESNIEVEETLILALEKHLFYFNLFLLSKLCRSKKQREKYKKNLLELIPSFDEEAMKLLSSWGHPNIIEKILL